MNGLAALGKGVDPKIAAGQLVQTAQIRIRRNALRPSLIDPEHAARVSKIQRPESITRASGQVADQTHLRQKQDSVKFWEVACAELAI